MVLARPELIPRDNKAVNRTAKKIPALRMAPVECSHRGSNSKVMRDIKLTTLKLSLQSVSGIELQKRLQGGSQIIGLRVPEKITSKSSNTDVHSAIKRSHPHLKFASRVTGYPKQKGLPRLKVCVSDLVEYLDYLPVNHDYSYRTLSMHTSVICSIL